MTKAAILVDGGFYRKRARKLWGKKTAQDRADELYRYTFRHLDKKDGPAQRELYRIFCYDCPPVQGTVYHPLLKKNIDFGKGEPLLLNPNPARHRRAGRFLFKRLIRKKLPRPEGRGSVDRSYQISAPSTIQMRRYGSRISTGSTGSTGCGCVAAPAM